MNQIYFYDTKTFAYEKETVFKSIEQLFKMMDLDKEHSDEDAWNPLGEYMKTGQTVLLKPNLVMDENHSNGGTECLYTQTPVVEAVLKYVCNAVGKQGKIIIGDAPMQECNFEKLVEQSGYKQMVERYLHEGYNIELVDFRELITVKKNGMRHQIINDKARGKVIDLKNESEFSVYDEKHMKNMRITNYSPERLQQHHDIGKHEYYISEYLLQADVVVNMPKPKTHRKAGVTIALKNIVGINVRKEYLPHHTLGDMKNGGDQYKKENFVKKISNYYIDKKNKNEGEGKYWRAKIYFLIGGAIKYFYWKKNGDSLEGNWSGNNTISKTIVDLNKILIYANKTGELCNTPQRKVFNIADMIISGEKEGPVEPSPKEVGYLVAGENSVAFDMAVATMMGADIERIPTIKCVLGLKNNFDLYQKNDVMIVSNNEKINGKLIQEICDEDKWKFVPTSGWKDVFLS